eukprot:765806-Hanusia_phi.AAC.3
MLPISSRSKPLVCLSVGGEESGFVSILLRGGAGVGLGEELKRAKAALLHALYAAFTMRAESECRVGGGGERGGDWEGKGREEGAERKDEEERGEEGRGERGGRGAEERRRGGGEQRKGEGRSGGWRGEARS